MLVKVFPAIDYRFSAVSYEDDASKIALFTCIDTVDFVDGQKLNNCWIAIIGTYEYLTVTGSKSKILQIVPLKVARRGISYDEFTLTIFSAEVDAEVKKSSHNPFLSFPALPTTTEDTR